MLSKLILGLLLISVCARTALSFEEGHARQIPGHIEILSDLSHAPSCRVVVHRILYSSARSAEERAVIEKAYARKKLNVKEMLLLRRLLERRQSEDLSYRREPVSVQAIWDVGAGDEKMIATFNSEFASMRKKVVAGDYDWDDPNGVLPDELQLEWDSATRRLSLRFEITMIDLCLGRHDVRVALSGGEFGQREFFAHLPR